jgi:hypothetical protein
MTIVPSSVDINCMPVIAMIARPSTDGSDSGCETPRRAFGRVSEEPPTPTPGCQPTSGRSA